MAEPFLSAASLSLLADDAAAVGFPRLLVEHFGLSAQVVGSVHQLVQSHSSLQHVVDRSVLVPIVVFETAATHSKERMEAGAVDTKLPLHFARITLTYAG